MKIIEALKKIKHLDRKIEKTSDRISKWCSYIDDKEEPAGLAGEIMQKYLSYKTF